MFIPHTPPVASSGPVSAFIAAYLPIISIGLFVILGLAIVSYVSRVIRTALKEEIRLENEKPKRDWAEEKEEKPKRKNDEQPGYHLELGDDGELIEVMDEKPKRRED